MAILVKCRCGEQFQTNDANAGRAANCPDCGRELVVPSPRQGAAARVEETGVFTSGKAIASLLLGLASFIFAAITGIPAVLLGLKAIAEINRDRGLTRGRGIATAGIVLGAFSSTVLTTVFLRPVIEGFQEGIRYQVCVDHLRRIGLALHNYNEQYNAFPPAAITSKTGQPLLSWRVAILAQLGPDERILYKKFHLDEPWDSPHNMALVAEMPSFYRTADRIPMRPGETHYQVVVGKNTMFPGTKGVSIGGVTDGTSSTILVVEAVKPVIWTQPTDLPVTPFPTVVGLRPLGVQARTAPPITATPRLPVGGVHLGGFCALFADGSVHWIEQSIPAADFNALITRDGGEVVGSLY